jgi:hypothetical protein
MAKILVAKDTYATVDDEDALRISMHSWCIRGIYIKRSDRKIPGGSIRLHSEILGKIPEGKMVDHVNGNTLDNRKCNLRIVTPSQNGHNKQSLFRAKRLEYGIIRTTTGKWKGQLSNKGRVHHTHTYPCRFCAQLERTMLILDLIPEYGLSPLLEGNK